MDIATTNSRVNVEKKIMTEDVTSGHWMIVMMHCQFVMTWSGPSYLLRNSLKSEKRLFQCITHTFHALSVHSNDVESIFKVYHYETRCCEQSSIVVGSLCTYVFSKLSSVVQNWYLLISSYAVLADTRFFWLGTNRSLADSTTTRKRSHFFPWKLLYRCWRIRSPCWTDSTISDKL